MSSTSQASSRTPTKRLLSELSTNNSTPLPPGILSLGPVAPADLYSWTAVITGAHLPPATGYTRGRWQLLISIPATYPLAPPTLTFATRICHPNVKWETGEVCLDLLKERWTPVLTVRMCVEAVLRLLAEPGNESPLNIEMGALLRGGDEVAARGLVGFYCEEERFEGVVGEEA
ncbi:hypothetical protein BP5796_07413 [Coleophoma crateriformis]|uniref:UBC core domain-containing protein n=1 Tax=Coleophoma crateriformis TaxID=565419 RepID=A0A3D8RJE5_9HELO|nr:hypothetical protein BP5796_07413 [Coleophoma crateriformis]